jgi:hypothetical protein
LLPQTTNPFRNPDSQALIVLPGNAGSLRDEREIEERRTNANAKLQQEQDTKSCGASARFGPVLARF